jgi:hypothetical protein
MYHMIFSYVLITRSVLECVLFLSVDHYAVAFKAYCLFFLMTTIISPNEFVIGIKFKWSHPHCVFIK